MERHFEQIGREAAARRNSMGQQAQEALRRQRRPVLECRSFWKAGSFDVNTAASSSTLGGDLLLLLLLFDEELLGLLFISLFSQGIQIRRILSGHEFIRSSCTPMRRRISGRLEVCFLFFSEMILFKQRRHCTQCLFYCPIEVPWSRIPQGFGGFHLPCYQVLLLGLFVYGLIFFSGRYFHQCYNGEKKGDFLV